MVRGRERERRHEEGPGPGDGRPTAVGRCLEAGGDVVPEVRPAQSTTPVPVRLLLRPRDGCLEGPLTGLVEEREVETSSINRFSSVI